MDGASNDEGKDMKEEEAFVNIYQPYLIHQGHALAEYVESAEDKRADEDVKSDIFAEKRIDAASLRSVMEPHFEELDLKEEFSEYTLEDRTLLWTGPKFTVRRQPKYVEVNLSVNGLTATDTAYRLDPESFPSFNKRRALSDEEETEESPRKRWKTHKQ
ncbi:hypothetical protein DXG01_009374 [Tephrocybe rancida]|nr:hypothetical protein DXG01_009374 [Tephrocybe rancida]